MTKEKAKKGFIVRALDTVERVGNGLPNPATICFPGQRQRRDLTEDSTGSKPSGS